MVHDNRVTHSRGLQTFHRVSLRVDNVENHLVIRQGEPESLTLTADPETMSQITTVVRDGTLDIRLAGGILNTLRHGLRTSLTRARVEYRLTVRQLTGLEIAGLARVDASSIQTDRLQITFRGAGAIRIASLTAGQLDVDLHGTARIDLAGSVEQQTVNARLGTYSAAQLESRRAVVTLQGMARAIVWAADTLEATIRGPGSVQYVGSPRVRKHVSPLGSVTALN
jgi:hypothetical protein